MVMARAVFLLFVGLILTTNATARLNVAVTASFRPVLEALRVEFEQQSGIELQLSSASTGVLYQQILNGAPFDVFFAADQQRPALLQQRLNLDASHRQTYAIGQLVLVSADVKVQSLADLNRYNARVVIANPAHAPYGAAAQAVLKAQGFSGTAVMANNVSQARQYLSMELASVGLIAASVAADLNIVQSVSETLHGPLDQQRLVLTDHPGNALLVDFLNQPESQIVIEQFGYRLPEARE